MELGPLVHSSALWALAGIVAAILIVYAIGRRGQPRAAGLVLRILSIAALVIPAWTLYNWYRDLSRARELATRLAIETDPIAERVTVNGAALLAMGFVVMVCGIWLARRLP